LPGAAGLLLAHHPKKDCARCCLPLPFGLHACARCLGALLGMGFALAVPGSLGLPALLGIVALSFFHWGSEQAGLITWGRHTRLGIGFLMGFAYISALREAAFASPLPALAAAGLSISLFGLVMFAKARNAKNRKRGVWVGV